MSLGIVVGSFVVELRFSNEKGLSLGSEILHVVLDQKKLD
jgi:hypothetical protein